MAEYPASLFETELKKVDLERLTTIMNGPSPNTNFNSNDRPRRSRLRPDEVEKIQILAKKGTPLRVISRTTGVNYSTIHKHAKQFSKQQTQLNLSLLQRRELGYIVGFFVGDGSRIDEKRSGHYGAKFVLDSKNDGDISAFLSFLFKKTGKRVTLYSEGSWLVMKVYSKALLGFLQGFVNYEKSNKVLVDTPKWPEEFTFGFLGGLIDADGHVQKNKGKVGHFGASITTVNPSLVRHLISILSGLGLEAKVGKANPCRTGYSKKTTYFIRLGKAEFSKVYSSLICIKHLRCDCNAKPF